MLLDRVRVGLGSGHHIAIKIYWPHTFSGAGFKYRWITKNTAGFSLVSRNQKAVTQTTQPYMTTRALDIGKETINKFYECSKNAFLL